MTTAIGALTNVPAPGDPIRSPWAQDVTKLAVHTFANKAALDAQWTAPPDGAHAWTVAEARAWVRIAGVWCRCPDYGSTSLTTDATGFGFITHAVGKAPAVVVAMSGVPGGTGSYTILGTDTYATTNFRIRSSLVSANNVGMRWVAWP